VLNDGTKLYFTGGIGYRDPEGKFFMDAAWVSAQMNDKYYFYDQSLVNAVSNDWRSGNLLLTFGFKY
jgi:hypothetical protein